MSGDLIQFPTGANRLPADGYDGLRCPDDGSSWFNLGTRDGDDFIPGVVCLDNEGSVDGYSGTPHCLQCGREVLA